MMRRPLALNLALSVLLWSAQAQSDNGSPSLTLNIEAEVFSQPCSLSPTSANIKLDFNEQVNRDLTLNGRSASLPFTLVLTDCDSRIGDTVVVTFKGPPAPGRPDLLQVTGQGARAIAIGLEVDKRPLALETALTRRLYNGTTELAFAGYVALIGKGDELTPGAFAASASFTLEYP